MTVTFNTLHEEFRIHLRPFQPQSIVQAAFATLREPARDKLEGLQRLPWQIMLLVKWALQDEECSDINGRPVSRQEFDVLRQRLLEFSGQMERIGEGFWLSMRRLLYQQVAFQRRTSGGYAREAALLGTLPADHPLRALFLLKTGITPETFLDLAHTTYAAVLVDERLSVPFTWYRDLRSCFSDRVLNSFIQLISCSYPELVTFCRELRENGAPRKVSEFYELTPIRRFPFLRTATTLECWHPTLFLRGMEGMVHSILGEAGAQYIEPFSKLFERHIVSELKSTGCVLVDEDALKRLVGNDAQVPDGLLSFPEANVFVEAKAGLFDESLMVVGTAAILRHKTRAVEKAIGQGWAAATGVRQNPNTPEQVRNAPIDYLLVVTNRELNASKGTSLKQAYPAGTLEYPNADAERYLPLERVYVLSVDDFERVVAAMKHDGLDLPTMLARCVEDDRDPAQSKFLFQQHLDAQRIKNGISPLLEAALDGVTERLKGHLPD